MVHWTTNYQLYGVTRQCFKFGTKRLRANRLGANWSWGKTTCYLIYRYIELPATRWIYSGTLNQELPAEFSVVPWSTSYWLNLQWNIELPAFSWMRTATLRLPATSWIHRGTLKYQLSVEFTVIHWAASFQLNLQWYNELSATSWIYSSALNYQLPDEFTVVHWNTSFQLNVQGHIELPTTSWIYSGALN